MTMGISTSDGEKVPILMTPAISCSTTTMAVKMAMPTRVLVFLRELVSFSRIGITSCCCSGLPDAAHVLFAKAEAFTDDGNTVGTSGGQSHRTAVTGGHTGRPYVKPEGVSVGA